MIRAPRNEDVAFIFATWLRSLYFGSSYFRRIDKETYFQKYKQVIASLLERSTVSVACLDEDPDVVLGYAVYEGNRLHWVYVKKNWRKQGVARSLVPGNITYYSHLTDVVKQRKEWIFDPFL